MKIIRKKASGLRRLGAKVSGTEQLDGSGLLLLGLVATLVTAATITLLSAHDTRQGAPASGFEQYWRDYQSAIVCESDPLASACDPVNW
jgi:hypothetical protein